MNKQYYMKEVIRFARKGMGCVSPNPLVGAIIVKNNKVLSKGYHKKYGSPHAEVDAIAKLNKTEIRNSTLYVNLEPCVHYGKTPPCADSIIQSGIKKVIIGNQDPNPIVNGKGIEKLKKAGIEVETGVMNESCLDLNKAYFKYITQKKPYVTIKIAQTLDGKISTLKGKSKWITSTSSRRYVHKMRMENDAILVGVNTVLIDDPELTVRMIREKGKKTKRIILDSTLRIKENIRLLKHTDPHNTIIVTTSRASAKKIRLLENKGVNLWILPSNSNGQVNIGSLLKKITEEKICSLLIEGGNKIFTTFLKSRETDRIVIFISPKLFGNGIDVFSELGVDSPDNAITFNKSIWHKIGKDMMFDGRL
jgi:diaminohydroxyphosphoribosylaminopyrimidine deaminase/5-amino-6-(5-phosphoribosylamino)uracil reductase